MYRNLFSKQEDFLHSKHNDTAKSNALNPKTEVILLINRIENLLKRSKQNFIFHNGVKITRISPTGLVISARFNSIWGPMNEAYWIYRESPEDIIITNSNGKYLPLTPKICQALQMVMA